MEVLDEIATLEQNDAVRAAKRNEYKGAYLSGKLRFGAREGAQHLPYRREVISG
jgi:hypothetical protein